MGNILVIDLEATCSNNNDGLIINAGNREIIEIGAVVINQYQKINSFQSFCKPVLNPILSPFCNDLTGIYQTDVEFSPLLETALSNFDRFIKENNPIDYWCSWGDFDKNQFIRECQRLNINNPLKDIPHINLKANFAKNKKMKQVGVSKALELSRLEFIGHQHRALDDAENIARLIPFCLPFVNNQIINNDLIL